MSDKKPEEPNFDEYEKELDISPLDEDAFQMYELFNSLTRAGFHEKQALYLVAMIINDANDESYYIRTEIDDDDEEEGQNKNGA